MSIVDCTVLKYCNDDTDALMRECVVLLAFAQAAIVRWERSHCLQVRKPSLATVKCILSFHHRFFHFFTLLFLSCIEYMRCSLQTVVTDVCGVWLSVCLSRGSSRLHCEKMAERIKILFEVNTPGGPKIIVLHGAQIPHSEGRQSWGKFCQLWTHCISQQRLKLET